MRGLLAGAAEVDITPPPGMPKAGHSRNAQTGTGFRTRLRSRVLHLRSGRTALTLVQNDLLAGSALLQYLVAEACADLDVPLAGLFIGATHTHAGPGPVPRQRADEPVLVQPPGLRRDLDGVARRADRRRGAGRGHDPRARDGGVRRDRGVGADPQPLAGRARAQRRRRPRRAPNQAKYAAINPWLHLLRVDTATGPLAASAFFSIHGTGISHSDDAYNADVWAYLVGELSRHIERSSGRRAVVGAVEGTHGDVAPAVRPGLLVYPEAERVGSGIGAAAGELWTRLEGELRADLPLASAYRELDLAARPTVGGITLPSPAFGSATIAGAHENTTPVVHLIPPFRPEPAQARRARAARREVDPGRTVPARPDRPARLVPVRAAACRSCGSVRPRSSRCRSRSPSSPAGGSRPRCTPNSARTSSGWPSPRWPTSSSAT